jgi:2-oxo-3-hexenedioate decarboxylase/2-keto-4-pentenoate hydratase
MTPEETARAVEIFTRARLDQAVIGRVPPEACPPDLDEAYVLQQALGARLDATELGPRIAHKIGCTTEVMQKYLRIPHPCAGRVHAETVWHENATHPHASFCKPGVECEIAVRLSKPLPATQAPFDAQTVRAAVGACMAAIEIVDDRYEDFRAQTTPTLVADDFFNAGCVLGRGVENWQALDLSTLKGVMRINGREVGTGTGADVMGHPFNALAWLATNMTERGSQLNAGDVILLGSVVETNWVAPDDVVEIEIEGLGKAAASFPS